MTTVSGSRAGLTAPQPPQNRTCRFPRIRLKHQPEHTRSTAGTVRDGTSGGRECGSYLRWRGGGAPRRWCSRPARGQHRKPSCRPRTGLPAVPWRIPNSPEIHLMMCYSNSFKYKKESVRSQPKRFGATLSLLADRPLKPRNSAVSPPPAVHLALRGKARNLSLTVGFLCGCSPCRKGTHFDFSHLFK